MTLPADPVWKRDYSGRVRRLIRDGVDSPLATLFVHAVRPVSADADGLARARSATEAFLFRRLESLPETKARFVLNTPLPIAFDGAGSLEVDLLCADAPFAVELDGAQHLPDPVAYRRHRRKDQLLQLMHLRWTEAAAADLEGIADYLFSLRRCPGLWSTRCATMWCTSFASCTARSDGPER